MLGGIPLLREPPRYCLWQPTDGDGQSFYYVRDVPELLITGREREYFTWYTHIIRAWYSIARHPVGANDDPFRFIKNEAYAPTGIDDDAIDEYVSKFSQPGGLRSMFNICKPPPCFVSPVFESRTWADTSISRSSDGIKRQAEQGSRQKGVGNARSRRRQRGLHRQRGRETNGAGCAPGGVSGTQVWSSAGRGVLGAIGNRLSKLPQRALRKVFAYARIIPHVDFIKREM